MKEYRGDRRDLIPVENPEGHSWKTDWIPYGNQHKHTGCVGLHRTALKVLKDSPRVLPVPS